MSITTDGPDAFDVPLPDDPHLVRLETRFEIPRLQGVGDLLQRTSDLYCKRFRLILCVTLILVIPFDVVVAYCDTFADGDDVMEALSGVGGLLQSGAMAFAAPAIIYGMIVGMRDHRAVPLGEALNWGGKAGWRTLGYRIVYGLLVALGLVLLIVPGLLFMVWYALVDVVVAAEGRGHPGVLARSKELTAGNRWRIFAMLLILMVIMMMVSMAWGGIEYAIWEQWSTTGQSAYAWTAFAVGTIFMAALSLATWLFTAMAVVVYMDGVGTHLRECPRCGYDLTGNVSGVCSECGTPVPEAIQPLLQTPVIHGSG